MVTRKKSTEGADAPKQEKQNTGGTPSGPVDIRRLFDDAHRSFVKEMQEAWQTAQEKAAAVDQKHFQSLNEVQAEAQRRAWELHNNYLRALLDASGTEEGQGRAASIHSDYVRQQHELQAETQQRAWELQHQHVRSQAETQEELNIRERYEQIYHSYLQNLQRAWAEVDITSLDPSSLAAISQSLATVATAASNVVSGGSAPRR
jgi:hypothetical protein